MESIIVRSCIKPTLKRRQLLKATLIAGSGVALLALTGSFVPPDYLRFLGWPLLFIGGALIAWGMVPYRRLCRKEDCPDELHVVNGQYLRYHVKGKPVFSVPFASIAAMRHIDSAGGYGIAVSLKEGSAPVIVHDHRFDYPRFRSRSERFSKTSLFFPYFSRQSMTRLLFC